MVHYSKISVLEYDNFGTIFQFFFRVRTTSIVISDFWNLFYFAKPLSVRMKNYIPDLGGCSSSTNALLYMKPISTNVDGCRGSMNSIVACRVMDDSVTRML